jgi:hypothetical protein
MSVIRDPDVYDRFEKIILIRGVRTVSQVAYEHHITHELPHHEFLGDAVSEKLIYHWLPHSSGRPARSWRAGGCRLTQRLHQGSEAGPQGVPLGTGCSARRAQRGAAAWARFSKFRPAVLGPLPYSTGRPLYNYRQLHSTRGYLSPMQYEERWHAAQRKMAA